MRELLSSSSQRLIKTLEMLLYHEGWTTYGELSAANEASRRTVLEDVAKLNKRWGRHLNLEVSKKNGIRLQNQNIASIGRVFLDLFNESISLRWLKKLIFHPDQTLEYYQNELFVSRSTLLRRLPRINRFLAEREMSIESSNNLYRFTGEDEQRLRDFSACFLLELYGLDLAKYNLTVDRAVIRNLVLSTLKRCLEPAEFSWHSADEISITYLTMFYIVSLVRENQGFQIDADYRVEEELQEGELSHLQQHFPRITKENLRPIHQCIFNQYHGWSSDREQTRVGDEIKAFLQRVFSAVPYTPDRSREALLGFAIETLFLRAKSRPFKTSTLFNRVHYFSLSLKKTNPLLYQNIEENLKIFSQNIELDIHARLADILFFMCLICPELGLLTRSKSALLIVDFGQPHARFLAKYLAGFFNREEAGVLNIEIAPCPEIPEPAVLDHYDILITTVPGLLRLHRNGVLIDDYPSQANLCDIYGALVRIAP